MQIRLATLEDLEAINQAYEIGRQLMRDTGNASQWVNGYPQEDLLRDDIAHDNLYVCEDENGVLASVFCFMADYRDPTYEHIDGSWLNEEPYGVVHRIASTGTVKGSGTYCIKWSLERCKEMGLAGGLRIDTHADNIPMHHLMEKLGFAMCGIIYVEDGTPRDAFQILA